MSVDDEPLELTDELIDVTDPDETDETDETGDEGQGAAEETVIAFADENDDEAEQTPLVKRLRQQLRDRDRRLSQMRRAPSSGDADPEPTVPARPRSVADFDYDEERFNEALDQHLAAKDDHSAWKQREEKRKGQRSEQEAEQARQIEQQRKALGVGDYEAKAGLVRERFTDAQMSILISGADNPAQVIYALGRSESRLDMLAGEENLAKFAVMLGKMEKDIKVTKKNAPAPETRVRGATGSISVAGSDKRLEQLEKEADKTGDRSKLIAYRASIKNRAA
jgi:hypothetical protein